ncbi:MAG: efflux RND transporter permease subunit, partial [Planctomycetota bacterium]
MSLTSFTLHRRAAVLAMLIVVVIVGVVRFMTMPRRADPLFTIRTAQVITRWPGIDAQRVDELVSYPLEQAISEMKEIDVTKLRSTTTRGLSVIYAELSATLPVEQIPECWEKVRAKIDEVRPELPPDAYEPLVNDDFGDTAVMLLTVHERGRGEMTRYTMRDLEVFAEYIQQG